MRVIHRQKGITLVALVITIIILLILAGITISSLKGSELFEKAQQAQQETEDAKLRENTILNEYAEGIERYTLPKGQPITNINIADTNPEAALPQGAIVIEGNANKGIVIKDTDENEWVWVEVPKTEVFSGLTINADEPLTSQSYTNIYNALNTYASDYRDSKFTDEWYSGCGIEAKDGKTGSQIYTEMYNKMLSSVYKNGGFWIARYEAGIVNTNTDTKSNQIDPVRYSHSDINSTSPKAVSQANRMPYNYVYCSEAQKLASTMSSDSNKTSSLLFGIQWDLTCKFLQEKGGLTVPQLKSGDGVGSTNWGNYRNSSLTLNENSRYCTVLNSLDGKWLLYNNVTENFVKLTNGLHKTNSDTDYKGLLTTGASEDAKKMNIYDFAGNVNECTLEKLSGSDNPCVYRGGFCNNDGFYCPSTIRFSGSTRAVVTTTLDFVPHFISDN